MTNKCIQCGRCCSELGQDRMVVSNWDITRWIQEKRWDILKHITQCMAGTQIGENSCYDIIKEYKFKQCDFCHSGAAIINVEKFMSGICLFLKEEGDIFACSIQETKPDHCSKWNVGKHSNCRANIQSI